MSNVIAPSWVNMFNGAIATNSAPSAATAGIKVPPNTHGKVVVIRLRHTATGARTVALKLWGYCPTEIYDAEYATAASRGDEVASSAGWDSLEQTYSLTSTTSNGGIVAFVLESPTVYQRLYVEITAITGTTCTVACAAAFTE